MKRERIYLIIITAFLVIGSIFCILLLFHVGLIGEINQNPIQGVPFTRFLIIALILLWVLILAVLINSRLRACNRSSKVELANSEERYRSLVESVPDMIITLDQEGTIQFINRTVSGFLREEVIGKNVYAFIEPGYHELVKQKFTEVFKNKKGDSYEIEGHGPDGSVAWYATNVGPIFSNNKVVGLTLQTRDITKQKNTQRLEEGTTNRFKSIFNGTTDAIILANDAGQCVEVNPAAAELLGFSTEELLSLSFNNIVANVLNGKNELDNLRTWEEFRKKGDQSGICELKRKDGKMITCLFNAVANILPGLHLSILTDITERKNAEDQIRKSESELVEAQILAKYGNWSFDVATHVTTWSEGLYRIFGVDEKFFPVTQESFIELVDVSDRDLIRQTNTRAIIDGKPFDIEYCITTPAGEKRIIHELGYGQYDSTGMVVCLFGTSHDITQRKLMEAALKTTEEKYKLIVETAQEGIWMIDENNINLFVNQPMASILGCKVEDMIGRSVFDFMNQEEKEVLLFRIARRKTGISDQYEFSLKRSDGKVIWLLMGTTPIIKDGLYKGSLAMIMDITEKKSKDLALLAVSDRLHLATRNANVGIWDWDVVTDNLVWDEAMYLISGLEPGANDNVFTAWKSLLHPDDKKKAKEDLKLALVGKKEFDTEFRLIWPDKTIHYIKTNALVQRDEEGNAIRVIGTNWDITNQKKSELETLELLKQLQLKNKDLRQFAYIVSHNLRAPIAKIQGLVFLIHNDLDKKTDNPLLLKTIAEEVINLDNVVKDMNDILCVQDSGNKKMEWVFFEKKLKKIEQVLSNQINESKAIITSDFQVAEGVVTVRSYCYSIMYNLLSNAIKYRSPERQLHVHLKTTCDKAFICLSVKDNGMGIDLQKNGEKIFGLYKRFHGNKAEGKGIGLNLVKAEAESLGGRVEVTSKENEGAEFKIYLPITKV